MATKDVLNNSLSGQTGTGTYVGANTPTLITPVLGAATGTSINLGSSTTMTGMIDDDSMATASSSTAASSESIKAYVDAQITANTGRLLNIQRFSTVGTDTYNLTAGTTKVIIEAQGGGGGGGAATNDNTVGGGGSGGGYVKVYWTSPSSQTVTVGAAGTAGSGATGGNGGNSSVGTIAVGNGGTGGWLNGSGAPVYGGSYSSSAGTIIGEKRGNPGGNGGATSTGSVSGYGGYGGGAFYSDGAARGDAGGGGGTAAAWGGGGGGGYRTTLTSRDGGPGAQGLVIIYEYS